MEEDIERPGKKDARNELNDCRNLNNNKFI